MPKIIAIFYHSAFLHTYESHGAPYITSLNIHVTYLKGITFLVSFRLIFHDC
jgi:hypothetical protein